MIAERLVIAEATAQRHLANIFLKVQCSNRAQLTAWACAHLLPAGAAPSGVRAWPFETPHPVDRASRRPTATIGR
jgi:hypothetical protein